MAVNKRLIGGAVAAPGGITPSEHFGVVLYEGDGASSHSINGGKFGAGAYFNGSNGKIIYPTGYPFNQANSIIAVSAWVKLPTAATEFVLLGASSTSDQNDHIVLIVGGNRAGRFFIRDASGSDELQANFGSTNNTNWNHYVWQLSSTNGIELWVNGVSQTRTVTVQTGGMTTSSWFGDIAYATAVNYHTGINRVVSTAYYKAKVDQMRLFTKELSSSEVSTLYAETLATSTSLDPLSEDTTDTLQVLGDSSCVAAYQFENNETDLSGNYDGTGTEIQYAVGRYGQAASFNGSSSDVTISGLSSMFGSKTTFSVSLWFKTTATGNRALFDDYTAQNYNLQLYLYDGNLNATVRFGNNDGNMTASSSTYNDGNWHHVVVTSNQTTYYTYVDGSQIRTWSAPVQTYSGGSPTPTIGAADGGTANYFDGEIDQVRIFNKQISASEVTTLYQENSLVASYRFEGSANDDTRNNDGTATNVSYEYGLNFTPDFVWIKERTKVEFHRWFDSTRGATKYLGSDNTNAEGTGSATLTSFDTGGFTLGLDNEVNDTGVPYVAWCLKANGGTTSSNTDGSITSTVQANTDAGFSIVTYTGTGSNATVGHGLGVQPYMVITKGTDSVVGNTNWKVYHNSLGGTKSLKLNSNDAATTSSTQWNDTDATSSVFSLGTSGDMNGNGAAYIAYCFAEVDGFSKFGSYSGTGAAGNFIETGFEPAFIMFKRVDTTSGWLIFDNKRNLTNPRNSRLEANNNQAEQAGSTSKFVDFYSNGFEPQVSDSEINASGGTYIYMAFAADPDTEAPAVAKSFSTNVFTDNASSDSLSVDIGFKPGLIWTKYRGGSQQHYIYDNIRSKYDYLSSNDTYGNQNRTFGIEPTENGFTKFGNVWNRSGTDQIVAWTWKANDNEPTIFGGAAKAVYKFEDNGNDVTGSWNATPTSITYGTGKFNKGAIFNGTSSKFTTSSSFDGTNGGSFSLSLWVKFDDVSTNENVILGRFSYTTSDKQFILRLTSSSTWRISVYNSSGSGESMTTTETASTDTWYHLVVVVDGTKKSIYVDGDLLKSETGSISPNSSATGALEIGGSRHLPDPDNNGDRLEGMMDQLRIFNAALTDVQVAALYAETASDNDDLFLGGPPETIISANANAGFSIVQWEGTGTHS